MSQAGEMALRLCGAEDIMDPWPHSIIENFLPDDLYQELLATLPAWTAQGKTQNLRDGIASLLRDERVEDAIRDRWNFTEHDAQIELTFRTTGLLAHKDRADKAWSGIVYLRGDPNTGTDLHGRAGVTRVEFAPNRLLCWGHQGQQHSVPPGNGRWAIQWWFLKTKHK